ncbi:glycoside hydrolase family 19 protein [Kosakonia sp. BYX6]|uniref:Glycoside hydrolase family 19 protein n=1 Tax=Kosakonia calanthes TaxID=3139408 RepID=A0ABZ3B3X0_9ENTR
MMDISADMLWNIARHYNHKESLLNSQYYNVHAIAPHLNNWFTIYRINTKLRVAHFLAQACVETANFAQLTEVPKYGGKEYDYDTAIGRGLGNTQQGDGPTFIGRGLLHLTGRENYDKFGKTFNKDYVNNPTRVGTNPYVAVKAACYYWDLRNVNAAADRDDINKVTLLVNGGYNGLQERKNALVRAKRELGI